MRGKSYFVLFFLIIFLAQIFLVFYFNRAYFYKNYDSSYWKDRFEHSQWQLPLSTRIIGDDGLFSYVGYRLIKGDDPSKINPETPPVAKYFIGFSIYLFNNPVFYSLLLGFFTLLVFFFLSLKLLKNRITSAFAVLILFLDPLIFSQFWKSWIDITQLFFLLLNILCLVYIGKKYKLNILLIFLSGLSLGFFSETKLPVLLPIIIFLETLFFIKSKLKKEYILYILGFIIGALLPYAQYFMLGYGFIDFLRLQKFIVNFYVQSKLETNVGAIWQALVFGIFPKISEGGFTKVSEWSLMWPAALIFSAGVFFYLFKKRDNNIFIKGILIFLFFSLLIFGLIPSYPRYLILIIPFLYILFTFFMQTFLNPKYQKTVFILVLLYGIVNAYFFLLPKPDVLLNNFYYNFSNQYFKDIYEENIADKPSIDREKFYLIAKGAMDNASVKNIEIQETERNISLFSEKGNIRVKIIYKTQDLGAFTEEKNIGLVKENSQWKINWDWNILLKGFSKDYIVKTTIKQGKRGSIIVNGKTLVKDGSGYLISVNPNILEGKKETEMLKLVENLSGIVPVRLQNSYLENVLPDTYISLVTTFKDLTAWEKEKLASFKGLRLTKYSSRLYNQSEPNFSSITNTFYQECCSRIYSPFNYHGIKGLEKKYDNILSGYSGGKIEIIDKEGKVIRTVIKKELKNGQDVSVNL